MLNAAQPILVVEDSPEDFEATVRAFQKSRLRNPVYRCVDGDDALDFLFQRGKYSDPAQAPRPGLILLDLNMPLKDGRECLQEIKSHSRLRRIPVVILTTSRADEDICRTYDLGANSYISKPVTFEGLVAVMKTLSRYWFDIVQLPAQGGGECRGS